MCALKNDQASLSHNQIAVLQWIASFWRNYESMHFFCHNERGVNMEYIHTCLQLGRKHAHWLHQLKAVQRGTCGPALFLLGKQTALMSVHNITIQCQDKQTAAWLKGNQGIQEALPITAPTQAVFYRTTTSAGLLGVTYRIHIGWRERTYMIS